MARAHLPAVKELDDFVFSGTPIDRALVRQLATGSFLQSKRSVVFIGGTGTGKTHLAIALARNCIRCGARGRFENAYDLAGRLEREAHGGQRRGIADELARLDFLVLDELNCPSLSRSGYQHLFQLLSELLGRTSLVVTTTLPFADWPATFGRTATSVRRRLLREGDVVETSSVSHVA
jgi:DNA replication protein DnaC